MAGIRIGVIWALVTISIWSGWPAATRLSVAQSTLTPLDLVWLRYVVGGLVLLPVLIRNSPNMNARVWRWGVLLAFCFGAPVGLLQVAGLSYAPAGHAAALVPGVLPLFVCLLSLVILGERIGSRRGLGLSLILVGAVILAGYGLSTAEGHMTTGHILFLLAAFLGAIYSIYLRRSGATALQGAALVTFYSMIVLAPLPLFVPGSQLAIAPTSEVAFQIIYQGVLMGSVSLITFNQAIAHLGAARAGSFASLVPVLAMVLAIPVLGEVPTPSEVAAAVAIGLGVFLALTQPAIAPHQGRLSESELPSLAGPEPPASQSA